jgi:flavorubredoxin
MIAPSHGVIWRENPAQIIDKYYEWSQDYNEGTVVIIYDTMYNATKMMAEAIGEGMAKNGIKYKLYNNSVSDQSDVLTEIFKAKGVIIGSCTVNNTVLRSISALLDEIKGHRFKNKVGAAFGSYGWSGEAPKIISKSLEESGVKILHEPLQIKYRPTEDELKMFVEMGDKFAKAMNA